MASIVRRCSLSLLTDYVVSFGGFNVLSWILLKEESLNNSGKSSFYFQNYTLGFGRLATMNIDNFQIFGQSRSCVFSFLFIAPYFLVPYSRINHPYFEE